jgi:hypothetical protein
LDYRSPKRAWLIDFKGAYRRLPASGYRQVRGGYLNHDNVCSNVGLSLMVDDEGILEADEAYVKVSKRLRMLV